MTTYYKILLIIIISIFLLLLLNILYRKKNKTNSGQVLTHVLLYLLEITIVTSSINYFIEGYQTDTDTPMNILRNHLFAYTIYQLLLFVFFKLKDSTEIDSLATVKNLSDMYQIYAEFNKPIPPEIIEKYQNSLSSNKVTMSKKHREYIDYINILADSYNRSILDGSELRMELKQISRNADFETKILNYSWMNSILLRSFK
jgi:hypothetical protein